MEDEINNLRRSNSVRDILRKMNETDSTSDMTPSLKPIKLELDTKSSQPVPKPRRRKAEPKQTPHVISQQITKDRQLQSQVNQLNKELLEATKDLKKMNIKNSRLQDTVTRYDSLLAEIQAALIADIKEKEAIIHSIQSVCNKFEISL